MRIKLIGFDSMGTRGMATVIDTGSLKVFIDPGVSLAPRRFGLPPHRIELERLNRHLEMIYDEVMDSDIIVISHYHRDHYLYRIGEEEYYRNKIIYAKHAERDINYSQKIRAYILYNKRGVKNIAKKIEYADNKRYRLDRDVTIEFSPPLPHGPEGTRLGYVIITTLKVGDKIVVHASDVQGPISDATARYIAERSPDILIISGPPTYFKGYKMDEQEIIRGFHNLERIISNLRQESIVVVDHHLLRDLDYASHLEDIRRVAEERSIEVKTAAEYMGRRPELLEAMRRQLWKDQR